MFYGYKKYLINIIEFCLFYMNKVFGFFFVRCVYYMCFIMLCENKNL